MPCEGSGARQLVSKVESGLGSAVTQKIPKTDILQSKIMCSAKCKRHFCFKRMLYFISPIFVLKFASYISQAHPEMMQEILAPDPIAHRRMTVKFK